MSDGDQTKKHERGIKRLNSFLSDPTIDIEPLNINGIGFVANNFVEVFNFYEYRPKKNDQPCYNNFENPFVVERDIIDLLKEVKLLSNSKNAFPLKVTKRDNSFNLKSQLVSLNEIYIFLDKNIQVPFKVHVRLDKNFKNPFLKVNLKSYSFNYHSILLNNFQLILVDMSDMSLIKKVEHKFEIINKNMFIGNNRINNDYGWKMNWYKKFDLPSSFNLKRNKYKIFLTYNLELDGKDEKRNFKLKYSNKIGIEDQGFNGNQVNKKMSNWRNLKIFNFIM